MDLLAGNTTLFGEEITAEWLAEVIEGLEEEGFFSAEDMQDADEE